MSSPPQETSEPVQVFIIYQSHEEGVAEALKQLIQFWGYSAYYCRQDTRDMQLYRQELREKLIGATLVIILLSHELYWSPYSQSEIGIAAATKKKILALIIPPATQKEANAIAPVLDGYWMKNSNEWVTDTNDWLGDVEDLRQGLAGVDSFSKLRDFIRGKIGSPDHQMDANRPVERVYIDSVKKQLSNVKQSYLDMPRKTSLRVWPRPALQEGSLACKSIIRNIQRALLNKRPVTKLAFVGVSLKFSLRLITEALGKLAADSKKEPLTSTGKKLFIKLVHMDDQAHFLHAIEDYAQDIKAIRANFHEDWQATQDEWQKNCRLASIELLETEVCTIDYIPPRVGILIDYGDGDSGDCVFYAGRCAFNEPGNGFRLWVGELEYLFFNNNDPEGHVAIEEFKCFLKVYALTQYSSGVVPTVDSDAWVIRLKEYLTHYPNIRTMTVISISADRCGPLIIAALRKGIDVNIYVRAADGAPKDFKKTIKDLGKTICRRLGANPETPLGVAYVFFYKLPSAFRAVLIDGTCLGVQMYVRPLDAKGAAEFTVGGPLPLIIPASSSRFNGVKSKIIDLFIKTSGASDEWEYKIVNGKIILRDEGNVREKT